MLIGRDLGLLSGRPMIRLFVAVVPPDPCSRTWTSSCRRRDAAAPPRLRWTSAEQWHLTLAFMADVADRRSTTWWTGWRATAARHRPSRLRVVGGGAFPNPDRARVLWAGLERRRRRTVTGWPARAAATSRAPVVDGQRFQPHLTLARLGRPAKVSRWVRLLDGYAGPAWTVEEFALMASHLGEGPRRRPRHEVVATLPLARPEG